MPQRTPLTSEQARVRAHLERIFPDAHSAAEVAAHLGLDVPAAVLALQELWHRGYAHLGPMALNETAETEVYEATTRAR
jgi:hypothetical protein